MRNTHKNYYDCCKHVQVILFNAFEKLLAKKNNGNVNMTSYLHKLEREILLNEEINLHNE